MFNVTFAVKAHWVVARRAPTQGEFRGDQTDAKVGSTPGAARGVRARSRPLVVAPYSIKGVTRPPGKGLATSFFEELDRLDNSQRPASCSYGSL